MLHIPCGRGNYKKTYTGSVKKHNITDRPRSIIDILQEKRQSENWTKYLTKYWFFPYTAWNTRKRSSPNLLETFDSTNMNEASRWWGQRNQLRPISFIVRCEMPSVNFVKTFQILLFYKRKDSVEDLSSETTLIVKECDVLAWSCVCLILSCKYVDITGSNSFCSSVLEFCEQEENGVSEVVNNSGF